MSVRANKCPLLPGCADSLRRDQEVSWVGGRDIDCDGPIRGGADSAEEAQLRVAAAAAGVDAEEGVGQHNDGP